MNLWAPLIHLGDAALTMPLAAGMAAWLIASHAYRLALSWSAAFAAGALLVGASKIAYMAWGLGWLTLEFKALSGHATGASAVMPMLYYLMLARHGRAARVAGLAIGSGLGLTVAAALVAQCHHSPAEAMAGWLTGSALAVLAVRVGGAPPALRPFAGMLAFVLTIAAGVWLMQWAHLGYWMIKAARLLSGHEHVFSLSFD